jgi:asparagine synthase (glutamine-hydrolysing)
MNGFPLAAPDGTRLADCAHAAAGVSRWIVVRRDERAAPIWDRERRLLFAGDVRLYNRPELIAQLGGSSSHHDESDLELARQAYLRWGEESPSHLVGDFAFAAWDENRMALFAARDHLGVRPLYYHRTANGCIVASDVRQILAVVSCQIEDIDRLQVSGWLTGRVTDLRRSYFRGIRRLSPGHTLRADVRKISEKRYWMPPVGVNAERSYDDNCETLRATFRRAVRDRLESDRPIVAHSSGGFDSSTIVMAADEVYRSGPRRPSLVLASAIAPGFPSDESHYMDAVAARVSFEGRRWNVVGETTTSFPGTTAASPKPRWGPGGGPRRDLEIAKQLNAGVLLSGFLGDETWYAANVLRDFIRHGRFHVAARHVHRAGLGYSGVRPLVDACLGILPPEAAVRVARWLGQRSTSPARWMGPALRTLSRGVQDWPEPTQVDWPSHVICALWARLTSPATASVLDGTVEYGMEEGIEVRLPHADVRLIETVMSVPWDQRDPRGHHRRLGREALGPLLPPEFSSRRGQQPWTAVWRATTRRALPAIAPYIRRGPWLSERFVDRPIARAMFEASLSGGPDADPDGVTLVTELGALEAWLRGLFL